jgi:hypothetical protein
LLPTRRTHAFTAVAIAIIGFSAFVMLYQAFAYPLSMEGYLVIVVLFVSTVLSLTWYADEFFAALGVFAFSLVVRLMYYFSTHFTVLPWEDSYGQYALLRIYAEASRAFVLTIPPGVYSASSTVVYSQWPGFSVISLSFSWLTGLSLFDTAIFLTLLLYILWFLVGYVLIRRALSRISSRVRNLPAVCMAVTSSLVIVEIMPPYYKYDLPSAIMFLAGVILLLHIRTRITRQLGTSLVIMSAAIVVTHSITALLWTFLTVMFVAIVLLRTRKQSVPGWTRLILLPIFVAVLTLTWWFYYAIYLSLLVPPLTNIVSTLSLSLLSFSRGNASLSAGFASLTPAWILRTLSVRDYVVLGLLLGGSALLLFRPRVVRDVKAHALLLSAVIIAGSTEIFSLLSFEDRAFFVFAPLVGLIIALPLITLGSRHISFARAGLVLVAGLLMFAIAFGFWGSSYAPVYLYSSSVSPAAFGEHPLSWPAIGSYLSYASNPPCILTNEIYVTSLAVPITNYNRTNLIGDLNPTSGCIAVVFSPFFTYLNSSYLGKSSPTLPGFTYSSFDHTLNSGADTVFETSNDTVYYFP